MIADPTLYRLGEFHRFTAGERDFLYLVPAGAIFELDAAVGAVIQALTPEPLAHGALCDTLARHGLTSGSAAELLDELHQARVILSHEAIPVTLEAPPADFPLQSLVMNLTNQCNLSCSYCYEFGADKLA